jgi:HEAT repeat protein
LDQLDTLLSDLHSRDVSVQFSLLRRIDISHWNQEQIIIFEKSAREEPNPETQMHMLLLLTLIRRKAGIEEAPTFTIDDLKGILRTAKPDFFRFLVVMNSLPPPALALVPDFLRETGLQAFPEEILPFLFPIIGEYGSATDSPHIEAYCRHENPRVLLAAVEALERLNPDDVRSFIIPLLLHSSPGIQTTAIRLLYRWDPGEALNHFRAMLFGNLPSERQAALTIGYFFPFPAIFPSLLEFLSLENDPDLLKSAGRLFQVNPQPDVPHQLAEVWETTVGRKREQLGAVLLEVIRALSAAGLTELSPRDFLQSLREKIRERRLEAMVDHFQQTFESADQTEREIIISRMESFSHFSPIRKLLVQFFRQVEELPLRTRIALILGLPPEQRSPEAGPAMKPVSAPNSPLEISETASREELYRVLQTAGDDQKATAIRVLGSRGNPGDIEKLRTYLNHPAPGIIAATIEALSEMDSEWLSAFLPRLVLSGETAIRDAAIRALIHCDKRQALTLVEQLLGSGQHKGRSAGVFSLGFFDFPSIRELAAQALKMEENPDHFRYLGDLFLTHMNEENLVLLIEQIEAASDKLRPELHQLTTRAAEMLFQQFPQRHPSPDIWLQVARKTHEDRQRSRETPAPYALSQIKKLRSQAPSPEKRSDFSAGFSTGFLAFRETLERGKTLLLPTFGLMLLLLGMVVFWPTSEQSTDPILETAPATVANPRGQPLEIGQTRDIQGSVLSVFSDALRIQADGQTTPFHVKIKALPRSFQRGDAFRGRVKIEKVMPHRIEAGLIRNF